MKPISIQLSISNIFLIPCKNGYMQVDAGYEHDYSIYRKGLAKAGIAIESIRYLVLTHHHDDHAGFLNDLARDTQLTIIAHKHARDLLQTGKNDKTRGGGYMNSLIRLAANLKMRFDRRWTLTFPPFTLRDNDILLAGDDAQILPSLGIAGKIIYTPGHCSDHIVVALDNGILFCGDAAANFLLWAGTHYFPVFMTNMDEAYQSWEKMLATGAKIIYPAHGKPFEADKLRQNLWRVKNENLAAFF